jgi:hypothetical protein
VHFTARLDGDEIAAIAAKVSVYASTCSHLAAAERLA